MVIQRRRRRHQLSFLLSRNCHRHCFLVFTVFTITKNSHSHCSVAFMALLYNISCSFRDPTKSLECVYPSKPSKRHINIFQRWNENVNLLVVLLPVVALMAKRTMGSRPKTSYIRDQIVNRNLQNQATPAMTSATCSKLRN